MHDHKDGGIMRSPGFIIFFIAVLSSLPVRAGSNADHKVAIHIAPHDARNCNSGLPDIRSCRDIDYTHDGCMDVDAFPVFYDLSGVTAVQIGLSWPESWGSCAFTPCGFDLVIGEIVNPQDGFAGTWDECRDMWLAIAGYAWLGPTSGGLICPAPNPITGLIGVADCTYLEDPPSAVFCAGACGQRGDDPCGGGVSENKTWGNIKAMFR